METSSEKYGNERSSQDPRPHQLAPFVFFLIFLLIQFIPSLFFRSLLGCLVQQTVLFWWRLWCHSIKPLGANAIFRAFLTPLLSANRTGWDNGRDRHHRGHRHQHSIRRYGQPAVQQKKSIDALIYDHLRGERKVLRGLATATERGVHRGPTRWNAANINVRRQPAALNHWSGGAAVCGTSPGRKSETSPGTRWAKWQPKPCKGSQRSVLPFK